MWGGGHVWWAVKRVAGIGSSGSAHREDCGPTKHLSLSCLVALFEVRLAIRVG